MCTSCLWSAGNTHWWRFGCGGRRRPGAFGERTRTQLVQQAEVTGRTSASDGAIGMDSRTPTHGQNKHQRGVWFAGGRFNVSDG